MKAKEPDCNYLSNDVKIISLDRLTNRLFRSSDFSDFDHDVLQKCFERTLSELKALRIKVQEKITDQERECLDFEDRFRSSMFALKKKIEAIKEKFDNLDNKVRELSGKTISLTDQLEKKNTPRVRLEEAREMILEFYKYLNAGGASISNLVYNSSNDVNKLLDASVKIRKLYALCMELPNTENFLAAKQKIELGSQNLNQSLTKCFLANYECNNIYVLQKIADVMSYSQNPNMCAETFINGLINSMPADLGSLKSLPKGFKRTEEDICQVFSRPDHVMNLLMQSFFSKRLKSHLNQKLSPLDNQKDAYLKELYDQYTNVHRLIQELTSQTNTLIVADPLLKLSNDLFAEYLESYIGIEDEWFRFRINCHFEKFYKSEGHQKKTESQFHSGLFNGLKRDVQNRFNISLDAEDRNSINNVLVSQEVAVNVLEDSKRSFTRRKTLLTGEERNDAICQLNDILIENLIGNHIIYGLEMAYQAIPFSTDRDSQPPIKFLETVSEAIASTELLTKFCHNQIIASINKSATHLCRAKETIGKHRSEVEDKINQGLQKLNNEVVARIHNILKNNQKRLDFKIDSVSEVSGSASSSSKNYSTQACEMACKCADIYISEVIKQLDQNNSKQVLKDFGTKFFRVVIDNFYGFTFTETGGIRAMHDVIQYVEIGNKCKDQSVASLFDILSQLVNILLIKKENREQVRQNYIETGIPDEITVQFLSLRQDYKSDKGFKKPRDFF